MFSSYGELSTEVYEITKPIGHSFGDIELYQERLKGTKGKILELAVGSGRVFIPLLEAGYDVEGIDNSPEMLEACRKQCAERGIQPQLHFVEMQNFSLATKYEAIIIPAGSFLLIENRQDAIQCLQMCYDHLLPGGRLILDLFLQTNIEIGKVITKAWPTSTGEVITMEEKLVEVNPIDQKTVTFLKYEKWRNGALLQTELQRFPLRWYGVEEFRLILEKVGFSNIILSSNYEFDTYPTQSNQTITYEATRI